jgi:hypothetical protein
MHRPRRLRRCTLALVLFAASSCWSGDDPCEGGEEGGTSGAAGESAGTGTSEGTGSQGGGGSAGDGGSGTGGGTGGDSGGTGTECEPPPEPGPDVWSSNLPIVVIDTLGQEIIDDPRIVAHMGIIDNCGGYRNYITHPFNDYDGRITIEIRGSTSQAYPKKSYGFETQTENGENLNTSLLRLPPENDWVLYAPYTDKPLVRNVLAYRLAQELGHYAPRTHFCEVFVNDDYVGVYVLMEKIKRDSARVDITPLGPLDTSGDAVTGGYIIKIDKMTGAGEESWPSAYDDRVIFQAHDPKDVELVAEQKAYIETHVASFEDALAGPQFVDPVAGYAAYVDVSSFVDFMILEELGRAVDGYRSSTFLYKDRDSLGGRLTMGPLWDYDVAFGNADYCDGWLTSGWQYQFHDVCPEWETHVPFWWQRLLEDPEFARQLRCRWEELREGTLATGSIWALIDEWVALLDEAQERNFERWPILGVYVDWNPFVGQTYEEEVAYLRTWIDERAVWLDDNVPGTCP